MRLLHAKTFKLHSLFGSDIPPYAILSHRWGDSEVTLQDLESEKGVGIAQAKIKIAGCCTQALKDGYEYVWIDSCCIDKTSSAELSEAINSMFRWYQEALICYVYLSDVYKSGLDQTELSQEFSKSAWFKRGWTLQELLAPETLVFYDMRWGEIGTKTTLEIDIKSITGITHVFNFSEACIAQKMSWAANRITTRVEDEAYCLMGLFGVNMPILYGEGTGAFVRLQQEIIKQSDDESIFAWINASAFAYSRGCGMLANSSAAFKDCGDISILDMTGAPVFPYEMTNKGLRIRLQLVPLQKADLLGVDFRLGFLAPLRCTRSYADNQIAIRLYPHKHSPDTFSRIASHQHYSAPRSLDEPMRVVYVTATKETIPQFIECRFQVDTRHIQDHGFHASRLASVSLSSSTAIGRVHDPHLLSIELKSHERIAWVKLCKDKSIFLLCLTFDLRRAGIQIHAVSEFDKIDDISNLSKFPGPPVDRAKKTSDYGYEISATLRKVANRGLLVYHVSLTMCMVLQGLNDVDME